MNEFSSGHSFFTSHIYISIKILYTWVITVPLCRLFIFADFTLRVCLASQSIQIRKIAHVLWTEYLIEASSANSFCVFVPVNCRILWTWYLNLNTLLKKKNPVNKEYKQIIKFQFGLKKNELILICARGSWCIKFTEAAWLFSGQTNQVST